MWIYQETTNTALNLDHVARLFVEATGTGAALKADLASGGGASASPAAKTVMVAYFDSKADAQVALAELMRKREANIAVARLG